MKEQDATTHSPVCNRGTKFGSFYFQTTAEKDNGDAYVFDPPTKGVAGAKRGIHICNDQGKEETKEKFFHAVHVAVVLNVKGQRQRGIRGEERGENREEGS